MTDEYTGFNFRTEHGLPDNDVRDILCARDGSLWILTQGGVARFDGSSFAAYDHASTPDFRTEDPRVLAEDHHGNVWVGGKNMLLRMAHGSFRQVTIGPSGEKGENSQAKQLCADPRGAMWIGGNTTITRVSDDAVKVYGPENGLETGGMVRAMQLDAVGTLWVGTYDGFFRFDAARERFERQNGPAHVEGRPVAALALHSGQSGRLWGLFAGFHNPTHFHGFRGWAALRQENDWLSPWQNGTINFGFGHGLSFVLEDSAGQVWLPADRDLIHRIRSGALEQCHMALPRPDIAMCLREDREGSLWMGTLNSGLWRWQPRRMQSFSTADGLPHENVWAVTEGADGAVWVGTDGGLARFAAGRWQTWTAEQGLSRNNIRALAVDREGTVWIGTGEGLNSWRDGNLTRHPIPGDWFESKIRVILPTRDGALWVAGAASLHRLAGGDRKKFTVADGLAKNDVRALLEDSTGRLWIGTHGGGLQCYESGRFTTYSTTNGLLSGYVWALHQDADGALWIGTDSGLHRLRDGRIASFSKAQGLPDKLVNFILEDDLGQLWISHDRGIYRVRRAALNDVADGRADSVRCVSYTKADGLPSEETNGQKSYPPAFKARDGRLWFATTKGVVVMDPKRHHEENTPPRVVIEQFRVTGELVFTRFPQETIQPEGPGPTNGLARFRAPARNDFAQEEFSLPPGSGRVVEFGFTANTFVSADRARFKYRLLGLDENWVNAGTRRQALFTNLKPGRYRFQVAAANHHGVWNETGAACAFRIAPFFHETWWFHGLGGAAIAAAVAGLVAWRMRELHRLHRLERRAAVATERSRIAQDLHDGLGADLTRLGTLAELASDASEETSRVHLRKLAQTSRDATRGLKDLIWMANPANDTLESFLGRLCQSTEDFLRDTGIAARFDLEPGLPPLALSLDQRRNLLLVLREALNNVVKHSGATELLIRARRQSANLELTIQDNGRGFTPESTRSGALGLSGMRLRVEGLCGQFDLSTAAGAGTTLRIQLKWRSDEHAGT